MTSGQFDLIDPTLISIDRENRQRRELTNMEELIESIRNIGLINPPVVDKELRLIAGERRVTACLALGLNPIPVQYVEDLPKEELHLIELEENIKRTDLSWIDQTRAIEEYHRLKQKSDPEWSASRTAETMGLTPNTINRYLQVAEHLGEESVQKADRFSQALNITRRIADRKKADAKVDIEEHIQETLDLSPAEPRPPRASVLQRDFTEWAKQVQEEPYNFIHCDFPYGVGVGDKSGYSKRQVLGEYPDCPETYFHLLETFCNNTDNFVAPSAHLIFWFSMNFYQKTIEHLEAAGWSVLPYPLIWGKTDNRGIIADPLRTPRNIYETALFASRGDRKIVKSVGNFIGAPIAAESHTSTKPRPVLRHFFRMVVDEYSRVLDPTCGGGNALAVAEELGASSILGLEINPDFAQLAQENIQHG